MYFTFGQHSTSTLQTSKETVLCYSTYSYCDYLILPNSVELLCSKTNIFNIYLHILLLCLYKLVLPDIVTHSTVYYCFIIMYLQQSMQCDITWVDPVGHIYSTRFHSRGSVEIVELPSYLHVTYVTSVTESHSL